jgi:transposase-like protein
VLWGMEVRCPYCLGEKKVSGFNIKVVRFGRFLRTSDKKVIQRFRCLFCKKSFSEATLDLCFKQHKRTLNKMVAILLVSGVSQRRMCLILKTNRKTVARKLSFLGPHAKEYLQDLNLLEPKCKTIEFDDLETAEHTKLKPLSVSLAVESQSRRILGFMVSQMPAKGHTAALSIKKYGRRKDQRPQARRRLFKEIAPLLEDNCLIKSDENPHYPGDILTFFPKAIHQKHLGQRGCVVGQGELKKIGFDPLFSLNHTCAMLRANINRLFRKTWCITKKPENLAHHIALYAVFHNLVLIQK